MSKMVFAQTSILLTCFAFFVVQYCLPNGV
jgi:hypothetical protein